MELELIYQDAQLVLAVKPAGVLSEEGGMPELLRAQTGAKEIYCVHRLDKAVGGLMVYAKTREGAAYLSRLIAEGRFDKRYLAACRGEARTAASVIERCPPLRPRPRSPLRRRAGFHRCA